MPTLKYSVLYMECLMVTNISLSTNQVVQLAYAGWKSFEVNVVACE